jgi:hypothetical protein
MPPPLAAAEQPTENGSSIWETELNAEAAGGNVEGETELKQVISSNEESASRPKSFKEALESNKWIDPNRRKRGPKRNGAASANGASASTQPPNKGNGRRGRGLVTGSRQNAKVKAGLCRLDLFVFRVNRSFCSNALAQDIESQGAKIVTIEQLSPANRECNSFRVILDCPDSRKVMTDKFWPDGVCVRRFHPPKS